MKPIRSFYVKFALLLFALLSITSFLNVYFVAESSLRFASDVYQRTHWDLAAEFAQSIDSPFSESLDHNRLLKIFADFRRTHPGTIPLFTDIEGAILSPYSSHRLDPEVLARAETATLPNLPLLIKNPLTFDREVPFSVYKTTIAGNPGYVVVLLHSPLLDFLWRAQGANYLLSYFLFTFTLVILGALLVGGALFYFLSKNFRRILATVDSLAKGDFSKRINLQGVDEVAVLGNAIDHMADKLEQAYDQIEESDSLRRRLITDIFHDLRTPLTAINGFISAAKDRAVTHNDPLLIEHLEDAKSSLRRQNLLVADVFELTKVQAKEKQAVIEEFSLAEVVQDTILSVAHTAEEKGIELQASYLKDGAYVRGDINMTARVLQNLIGNALNYSDPGSTVQVSLRNEEQQICCEIVDSGCGIPTDKLATIFEPFSRVAEHRDRSQGGTGLGLAIVRHMLLAQDSEIHVESTEGEGSRFYFSLPRS